MYTTEQANLVYSYGAFFSQWDWDHFVTVTFGRCLSESRGLYYWNEFINSLGHLTRGRVGWVRSDEDRWSGCGRPEVPLHYHALVMYKNVPPPQTVADLWKSMAGDAQVEAYGSGGGAAWYLAKMFPYEDTRYDLGGLEHFARSPESGRALVQ
jgi:hypothetical protein